MARTRTRLVRSAAALVLTALGLLSYDAITQVASAAPPPVVTTDFAAYPPADAVPATCIGGTGGPGVLLGYHAFLRGQPEVPGQDLRDIEDTIVPGSEVVIRWTGWAAGCESLTISFPLKATNGAQFDIRDDQALVREPNGPYLFPFCNQATDPCLVAPGVFELAFTMPQLNTVCGYQLDVVIGGPLETVGPRGSYYQNMIRTEANGLGLGTFNPNPPNMLIDAANGAMPCTPQDRITIDKQWVGTGPTPPVNVPPDFLLTVTSSISQTNAGLLSTATCQVANGAFTCNYEDASAPGVPQGGLLVNEGTGPDANSMLTVTETGFPGNSLDITFPVTMASKYITCEKDPNGNSTGPCHFTITNTPPPPPPPPPTTAPPPTTIPPIDTSILPPPTPETLPPTLPATGSSDATPLLLFGLVLVPIGVTLVAVTRRRARAD